MLTESQTWPPETADTLIPVELLGDDPEFTFAALIFWSSSKLVLNTPESLPLGVLLQARVGHRLLLGEVTHAFETDSGYLVHVAVEHVLDMAGSPAAWVH